MHILSTNFAKMLVWKHDMTSNCDVTNNAHQIQMTTICYWTKIPPWKFSAYATGYTQGTAAQGSSKHQVEWLHLRPYLVPSWCGINRTIRDYWKARGILQVLL